ncbi:MAG: hypothetical protein HY519_04535 [Candidatus Aenigmarchaeota archaeon]|nr:hypothetical protein [Candidatus Aenigmarchaeota archaeon]
MPDQKMTLKAIITELVERTNSDNRRLRDLEKRVENFAERIDSMEETLLKQRKDIDTAIHDVTSQLGQQAERMERLEKLVAEVIKQMKKMATLTQVKELEEKVDIYNPLKSSFITKEELEGIIEERERS